MPYINKQKKFKLEQEGFMRLDDAGELNYAITTLLHTYLTQHGLSYKVLNEIAGALSCADKEFYRRITIPYENKKIKENGDVVPTGVQIK